MKTRFSTCVLVTVLSFVSGVSALSQSTTYFERGDFINACQTLPGIKQSLVALPADGPVLTFSNVTFTGRYLSTASIRQPGSPPGSPEYGALWNFDSGIPLGIHFANGARAFGGDFSSWLPLSFSSFTALVSLNNGESFSFTSPAKPDSRFFGFISPTPIMDITFSDGGLSQFGDHEEIIGNLYMVLEIPEPGSAALLVLGAAALLWRRRKACRT